MASNPISQAGVQGLRDSLSRAADAAARISQAGATTSSPVEIAEAAVDLKAAELQAKASAKVIETAQRTLGSVIDILAWARPSMAGIVGVTPVPVTVAHDPLGRAMTEEQKAKLQEQPSPPLEQAQHKERIADRREPPRRRRREDDDGDDGPGQIIDSYAWSAVPQGVWTGDSSMLTHQTGTLVTVAVPQAHWAMRKPEELSAEDRQRVEQVTQSGIHSVERKPFRPWLMILMLLVVVTLFSVTAIVLEKLYIP